MCTFMSTLPKHSKSIGSKKPKNLALSIRPCADEKTYYRFRLLAFSPTVGTSTRDDPHIVRYVHQIWGKNPEKGTPVLENEIICPVTPHVHVEGDRYSACKVCEIAGKYWGVYKDSKFKDREALRKNKMFGRKYQAIVPVYVVNDPNYDGNNGKFKVIMFNDKKMYNDFREKINHEIIKHPVFNAKGAVDCCIHMSEKDEVYNEGKPNEIRFKKKVIDKIVFTTKPYDIPSITKETIDAMEFDQTYFTSSTPQEIDDFYNKYCKISNNDIPEDDEIPVYTKSIPPTVDTTPADFVSSKPNDLPGDLPNDLTNDLADDPDDLGLDTPPSVNESTEMPVSSASTTDVDAQALIDSLDL